MSSRVGFRISKRASSVPVEPIRVLETHGASSARRISNAALDDTDAMMAASKRHDRQLLDDINTRLANQSLQAPSVGVVKHYKPTSIRKPPLPPSGRSTTVYSVTSTATPRRSAASRYADYDDDVDNFPPTPVTKSVIRASSVPPRLPAATIVTPVSNRTTSYIVTPHGSYETSKIVPPSPVNGYWTTYPDIVSAEFSGIENNHHIDEYGYVPTRVTSPPGQMSAVADLAIKQAHRNLDRIERELKHPTPTTVSFGPSISANRYTPKSYVEISNPDHLSVRRPIYHWTSNGTSPISSVRIRNASLSPLRGSGGSTYHRVSHPHRAVSPVRPSELLSLSSSPLIVERKITGSSYVAPKINNDTNDLRSYRTRSQPPGPVSPLFTIAGSSPIGAYSKSKPSASRNYGSEATSIPQPSSNVRPKMSEARRKVRDVLCKVKNDPHYYD